MRPSAWNDAKIDTLIAILRQNTQNLTKPMVLSIIEEFGKRPFLILISCLLSLRARDSVTLPICREFFKHIKTPHDLLAMPIDQLERSIYALGFYRRKAASLRYVSQELITRFHGKVPSSPEELLSIKGIGRKTANLVLGEAFGIPALCVDTHVHKISNRLGLVSTKTPDQTEWALKKILPQQYWIEYNRLLVVWGQNICVPLSPFCSKCPVFDLCHRVGVIKSR